MPDLSDVETAVAAFVSGALYPAGTGVASAIGTACRVYRGWPAVTPMEEDLKAGVAHVTVRPVPGSERVTTRYMQEWFGAVPACPLLAATDGVAVTFTGTASPGLVAGVRVDGRAYAWRVAEPSSPGMVAAVLGSMVRVDRPATVVDATITFVGGYEVLGRAVSDGFGGEELRRQSSLFRVSLWCPSPEVRDRVAAFIDLALAGTAFLDVDGWGCRVIAAGGATSDDDEAVRAWRRDLVYRIEYPTILAAELPALLFGCGTVNGASYVG